MIDFKALDHDLQRRAHEETFSGVVLLSRGSECLFAGAYGYASRTWLVPCTLDTRFDTASVTKLFTAVATLQLIEDGVLDLDTPVIERLGLVGTAISPSVTVYHLLTHTSGIADDADEENGEDYADLWKTKANYTVRETADFLPQFAYKPPNFAPGGGCRYCNCGYVLLGLLIEKITGMPYREYVRQRVFARAGMTRSGFFAMDEVRGDVAEGADPLYDEQGALAGWRKNIYSYPPIGSPDGGAHATAGDLDRFLRAVQVGMLLSPESAQAFLTPRARWRPGEDGQRMWGFGLEFAVDTAGQVRYLQKEGINAGASAIIRHYPDDDINVVLLSNMQRGVWDPCHVIHRLLVRR